VVAVELLGTKITPPRLRRRAVARERLTGRLASASEARLILISAPPGFGKTTLVTDWLAARGEGSATAWVSLEPSDAEPVRFWTYLLAAVESAVPSIGEAARALLAGGQAGVVAAITSLVNDLAAARAELVIVLDDLHAAETAEISDRLAFLGDHLPPNACLVIITRADPALPLARLRARGELVEIRASDLRFTPAEAAEYLNGLMGLGLGPDDIDALEARTEGWIAALQLAALSMEGRADFASFIDSFTGNDRYVVDYLADEVLERQPADVRTFLLETAVLDRLTGPLCDAVTGRSGGTAMLEALDRGNLFLVGLDDQRRWYRYHHLFADLLRARLLEQRPGEVPEVHRRASTWFEANGSRPEAIGHALAAGDVDRVANLIELEAPSLLRARQEATVRRWLDALPEHVFDMRPVLADRHAGTHLQSGGSLDVVDHRLSQAERWLDGAGDPGTPPRADAPGMIAVDAEGLERLPGSVALHRAGLMWIRGDLEGTIAHARAALELLPERTLERGGMAAILGLAQWRLGELDAAHAAWSTAIEDIGGSGHHADVLGCSIALADIELVQGKLRAAQRTYERGIQRATDIGQPALRGLADMHTGLAEVARERDDLAEARRHLDAVAALGEGAGLPQNPYRSRVAMARVADAEGDFLEAVRLLDEAERVYEGDFFPEVRPVSAVRARVLIRAGRAGEAIAWAAECGVSTDDELSYVREYEHITLARALLQEAESGARSGDAQAVGAFLDRLLDAAEAGGRIGSVIELLVLRGRLLRARGDRAHAAASFARALALAEPEGYVRLFVDEGDAVVPLLRETAKSGATAPYAARLLSAFEHRPAATTAGRTVDALSERELDVLRLLATDLSGPAIAQELFISLNTMRTHTKSIFAKLGVSSRRAAVRRAVELGLLRGTTGR